MGDMISGNPTLNPYTGPIDLTRPHFVGIGGWAMSGLARLCQAVGSTVSGSDIVDTARLQMLRDLGCRIAIGHHEAAVDEASCVVYTTFTDRTVEVEAAREAGIPLLHRAQILQEISAGRRLVAVTGTHGKSTTTAMIATALSALGANPSYLVGADLDLPASGAHHGTGEMMIAEADESDRSFLFLHPQVAVVTRIAHDHPENFDGVINHLDAYTNFAGGLRPNGTLIAHVDEPWTQELIDRVRRLRPDVEVITYGRAGSATLRIESYEQRGWTSQTGVRLPDGVSVVIGLSTPSRQHADNAVGALAALVALGLDPVGAAEGISAFAGVRRRFTRRGQAGGATVVDSYADHHNEINADLRAARAVAGTGKIIAVCQPSGYIRVQEFGHQIGKALAESADCTILLDIQGGAPISGITSKIVGDAIAADGGRTYRAGRTEAADMVAAFTHPGDVVLLMGTGDVNLLADPILAALDQARANLVAPRLTEQWPTRPSRAGGHRD